MIQLKVEKYTSTLFNGWTDGVKYLIDTSLFTNVEQYLDLDNSIDYVLVHPRNLVQWFAKFELDRISTFFVVGDIEYVCELVEKRPDLDVRLLLM